MPAASPPTMSSGLQRLLATVPSSCGIHDRDLVVVRRRQLAESGDIVVALLGEEATVKRLYIGDDTIELRPENTRHLSCAREGRWPEGSPRSVADPLASRLVPEPIFVGSRLRQA